MSRVERKKQKNKAAITEESIGNSTAKVDQSLPTRQFLRETKKNKKGSYPLLTALAVIFFCIPFIVWFGLRFLDVGPTPEKQLDEYEYRDQNDQSSSQLPSSDGGKKESVQGSKPDNETKENVAIEKAIPAERKEQGGNEASDEPAQMIQHEVKKEETLYRISMKYYNSRSGEKLIREHNHLSGNEVYIGQILEIPIRK
jgi:LysM repeat protein